MPNPSQLLLLADHIKLSLLERQRAISLNLEPNTQDTEISRTLTSLRDGIEATESEYARSSQEEENNNNNSGSNDPEGRLEFKDQLDQLQLQFRDLSSQFHGTTITNTTDNDDQQPAVVRTTATNKRDSASSPDIKQPIPQRPSTKSVRFMNNNNNNHNDTSPSNGAGVGYRDDDDDNDADNDPNRKTLFQPYRDSPSPSSNTNAGQEEIPWSNQQIHTHHTQVLNDQDDQLDRLGESIGRQHELSIQIGDELDGHVALLDGVDTDVERHQSRLDLAKRRLNKVRKNASENWSMMTIIGLIIVLVILIVILK